MVAPNTSDLTNIRGTPGPEFGSCGFRQYSSWDITANLFLQMSLYCSFPTFINIPYSTHQPNFWHKTRLICDWTTNISDWNCNVQLVFKQYLMSKSAVIPICSITARWRVWRCFYNSFINKKLISVTDILDTVWPNNLLYNNNAVPWREIDPKEATLADSQLASWLTSSQWFLHSC